MQDRQTHIDLLKALASQLIVLHHFAAYGPIGDVVRQLAPAAMGFLYDYARMAVQVFLVLGGFLAAQTLRNAACSSSPELSRLLLRRYQRLILPFLAALVMAMACAAVVRPWMPEDYIPAPPGWTQVLAHALLLHGVLAFDSLSAGVWYVAIDFQLFALMALCLWMGERLGQGPGSGRAVARGLLVALVLASMFYFNRQAHWDNWGMYFFAAYGMGAVASWAGQSRRSDLLLVLMTLAGVVALVFDFRVRIALAMLVALFLAAMQWRSSGSLDRQSAPDQSGASRRVVARLGQSSYALFLVHFPVLMLANAAFRQLGWSTPWAGIAMLFASWLTCMICAGLFLRHVERPLSRWGARHVKARQRRDAD